MDMWLVDMSIHIKKSADVSGIQLREKLHVCMLYTRSTSLTQHIENVLGKVTW